MTDREPQPGNRQALEEQDRLTGILDQLDGDEGQFTLEGRKVVYILNAPADDDIDERHPGQWMATTDMGITGKGGDVSLSIWVWQGVPEPFKKVILHHEVTEGLLELQYGIRHHTAHVAARRHHEEYARTHLTPEQLAEFAQWDVRLEHKSSEGEAE